MPKTQTQNDNATATDDVFSLIDQAIDDTAKAKTARTGRGRAAMLDKWMPPQPGYPDTGDGYADVFSVKSVSKAALTEMEREIARRASRYLQDRAYGIPMSAPRAHGQCSSCADPSCEATCGNRCKR